MRSVKRPPSGPGLRILGWLALVLLVITILNAGCGNGSGSFGDNPTGSVSLLTTSNDGFAPRSIAARTEISTEIDEVRVRGLNSAGELVYGPVTLPRSASLSLDAVPVSVRNLVVELLDEGRAIGGTAVPVTIVSGRSTRIANPTFVYADLMQAAGGNLTVELWPGWNPVAFKGSWVGYLSAPSLSSCLVNTTTRAPAMCPPRWTSTP